MNWLAPARTAAGDAAYSRRQAAMVLALMIGAALSFNLASSPLYVLTGAVRRSFGLSDVQLSLLFGVLISIPTLLVSLVGGWLSDRTSRRALLGAGVILWTSGAVLCALAANFGQIALGRVLAALGIGIHLPVAMTWIDDAFAPERRGRAVGIFFTLLGVGPAFAASLTGVVQRAAAGGVFSAWPIVGGLEPWRLTLLLLALPAVPLLPLVLRLRDVRTRNEAANAPQAHRTGGLASATLIPWGLLIALMGSMSLMAMVDSGNLSWMATVFERKFGYSIQSAGFVFGIIVTIAGAAGPLIGGWIGDRAFRRFGTAGRLAVCAGTAGLCVPLLFAYLCSRPVLVVVALTLSGMCTVTVLALGYVNVQAILPATRRGFGTGITNAGIALAVSFSPTLIALLSDRVLNGPESLEWALALTGGAFAGAAGIGMALTARGSARLAALSAGSVSRRRG